MTKKLGVSLLAIVLIVCMLSVGLFACKKDEPQTGDSVELQAVKAIVGGVQKSVENGDMKDLKVDGELGLKINNDKEYKVKLALDLNLLQYHDWNYTAATAFKAGTEYYKKDSKGNYVKAEGVASYNFSEDTYYTRSKKLPSGALDYTHSWIDAEVIDVKANKTLLGLYYSDSNQGDKDIYQGNVLYLQAATDAGQKKMAFPAPFIGGVQAALNGQVDFSGIDLTDEEIWDSLDEYLGIVASLAQDGVCTSTKAAITLNVGKLLDADPENEYSLITLVKGLQGYLDALGLDLKATDLGTFLPNITLTLSADLEDGMVTGIDISLGLSKKDMTLKTIDKSVTPNAKNELLVVKMDNAIDLTVSLKYAIGTATTFRPNDLSTYTKQGDILDAAISADLFLSDPIGTALELNGKELTIAAPAGYYKLSLEVAANPWEILANLDKYNFNGIENILDSIKQILQGVDSLKLELLNVKDVDGNPIDPDADKSTYVALRVILVNNYLEEDGKYRIETDDVTKLNKKYAFIKTAIIGGISVSLDSALSIDDVINLVMGFIETSKGGQAPAKDYTPTDDAPVTTAAAEDETTKLLKTIGGYLLGAYIGINDGVNGDIFAKFDSSKTASGIIPFSWYTEWQGGETDRFDMYIKKTDDVYSVADTTKYVQGGRYFTWIPETFYRVDTVEFDEGRYYYTRTGEGTETDPYVYHEAEIDSKDDFVPGTAYYFYEAGRWNEENITKVGDFKKDVTYYIRTAETYEKVENPVWTDGHPTYYVKGAAEEGGDFGIGLKAELKIDDGNISIEATVENLDVIKLTKKFTAKISNLSINLFGNDFPILVDNVLDHYATVAGKVK